ncbi:MAG: hypothetical protein ABIB98_00475 [bacterium]
MRGDIKIRRYVMGGYDEWDASQDTDVSADEVSEAWHTARDDSGRDWEDKDADYYSENNADD